MKTLFKPLFVILVTLSFSLASCELDDGIEFPDNDYRDKFLGRWIVSDNELKINYEVTISYDPNNSSMVRISNFAGSGDAARALAVGSSLVIEQQTIGQNWSVSGTGSYRNSGRIDFPYSLTIGGHQESRMALFTK
jgi:hypothetical protein